ncbi:MAG: hypothetical protein ABIK62_02590 [candidate division WOR-3 bacterium]
MIKKLVLGLMIVMFGAWLWIARFNPGLVPAPVFARDWPLLIVVAGLLSISAGAGRLLRGKA